MKRKTYQAVSIFFALLMILPRESLVSQQLENAESYRVRLQGPLDANELNRPYELGAIGLLMKLRDDFVAAEKQPSHLYLLPAPNDWISADEAVALFRYVYDKTPCVAAYSLDSFINISSRSTIGSEARRMIYSFGGGGYPPIGLGAPPYRKYDEEVFGIVALRKRVLDRIAQQIDANLLPSKDASQHGSRLLENDLPE